MPLVREASGAGTFASLYSGAGGMDIGFYQAGFDPVWANDIDPIAVRTYNQLFPDHVAHSGDIRKLDLPMTGSADIVIGGPPCQGFSVAGRMDPDDPRSKHVWDFLGVVDQLAPVAFVMENVKALAVNQRWTGLRDALVREAENLGFMTQIIVLNAADFAAPQARERMFMVGMREGTFVAPVPVTSGNPRTTAQALKTLPPFGQPGNDGVCTARVTPAKNPVLRRSPYAGMLFNGQGRPLELDRPALTLPASMGGNRTPIVDQDHLDGITVEPWVVKYHSHLWNGGEPARKVPSHLRRITVQEAAALQTFPREMVFYGTQSAQYRQIGNAVPPQLAYYVARAVRQSLYPH